MGQVIIVANRLPLSLRKVKDRLEFYPSTGGLATGLSSFVSKRQNRWVGWPGMASEDLTESEKRWVVTELDKHNCSPVFLSRRQIDQFYNGYSNQILWPLFHGLPLKLDQAVGYWKSYRSVNKLFAEAVLALTHSGQTIWVHDYHLLLLPQMLRAERPNDHIGFFQHIPFPSIKGFNQLSENKKILRGILGADLVGFHTVAYANNFLDACQQLKDVVVAPGQVLLAARVVKVTDFPMGIDYNKFVQASSSPVVKKLAREYKAKYGKRKIILTVDRLDPTKGLVQRLEAYKEFLNSNPVFHGRLVMAMLAVPSRTDLLEYQILKTNVEKLVAKINHRFGSTTWQPIDYMYASLPFEEVAALYKVADIAFIAPLMDGMNLVAKEFMASKTNKKGILILSQTAGAAQELTEALLVNPLRRSSLVAGLNKALNMSPQELKQRASTMQQQLAASTVHKWAANFVGTLNQPVTVGHRQTRLLKSRTLEQLITTYRLAQHRLLLFDYDGVLSPFFTQPQHASPPLHLSLLLGELAAQESNEVILISGRSKSDLETWFGDLNISLVAEHGAFVRKIGAQKWQSIVPVNHSWQSAVLPILEFYAAKTPGASVEVKDSALVWHYRAASAYFAQKYLVILKRLLRSLSKQYGLTIYSGHKILEIRQKGINKGSAITLWTQKNNDFVLAIGDDYTDEDMFMKLPLTAHTIKVGRGSTAAKYRLPSVNEVFDLLRRLCLK